MGREPHLKFPESFFKGEELEGFYVESMMKKAWAAELEVLYEVDRICKKHDISYYASDGTLLGAVRHKGFIPWDDDIDLMMLRKDYNRFVSIIRDELPKGFVAYYAYFDTYKYDPHMCIFNSTIYSTEKEYLEKFHGCPFPAGLDIFPLDTVPEDPELVEIQENLMKVCLQLIRLELDDAGTENMLAQLEELLAVHIDRKGDIRKQIAQLMERIVQLYKEEDGNCVTVWDLCVSGIKQFPRKLFCEKIELPFEIMRVPAVRDYDTMLRISFGDDYMTPIIGTALHEYPYYKKIMEQVEKNAHQMGLTDFECMK